MKTLLTPGIADSLVGRLRLIQPETPRRWGKMSSSQMICHLTDSFRSMMGERQISEVHYQRTLLHLALYLPLPWPKGFPTRPEVDQFGGGTKPADFDADLGRLINSFEKFAASARDFDFRPHPIFGPLTHWQWMRWGYLHTGHHLRQFGI